MVVTMMVDEIMRNMPQDAERGLLLNELGGFRLRICWKLKNDSERPNKRSKKIVIVVTDELIEDFQSYSSDMQKDALSKLSVYIAFQLKSFDPEHSSPRGFLEPVEEWHIPALLFG